MARSWIVVIFAGPDAAGCHRQYTALTGRPPLPQPWAFGVWKTALSGERGGAAPRRSACAMKTWASARSGSTTSSSWRRTPAGTRPWATRKGSTRTCRASSRNCTRHGFKVLGYLNTQFIVGPPAHRRGDREGIFPEAARWRDLPRARARPGPGGRHPFRRPWRSTTRPIPRACPGGRACCAAC